MPEKALICAFSATYSGQVMKLLSALLPNALIIRAEEDTEDNKDSTAHNIED